MTDDTKEVLTKDDRIVIYSTAEDAEEPADTGEWLASDTVEYSEDQP